MQLDHVVLWVSDPARALAFYVEVLGLRPERAEEFERGEVSFPSVRVNATTLLDLMDASAAPRIRRFTGGPEDAGGGPSNHVCLAMSAPEYSALLARLDARGVTVRAGGAGSFGAQGRATASAYFADPDGNVLEARSYA